MSVSVCIHTQRQLLIKGAIILWSWVPHLITKTPWWNYTPNNQIRTACFLFPMMELMICKVLPTKKLCEMTFGPIIFTHSHFLCSHSQNTGHLLLPSLKYSPGLLLLPPPLSPIFCQVSHCCSLLPPNSSQSWQLCSHCCSSSVFITVLLLYFSSQLQQRPPCCNSTTLCH